MGAVINAYDILVGKPEGKGALERPWRRWEDNIRLDLKEQSDSVWTKCI
jgi:hypothetical protein